MISFLHYGGDALYFLAKNVLLKLNKGSAIILIRKNIINNNNKVKDIQIRKRKNNINAKKIKKKDIMIILIKFVIINIIYQIKSNTFTSFYIQYSSIISL